MLQVRELWLRASQNALVGADELMLGRRLIMAVSSFGSSARHSQRWDRQPLRPSIACEAVEETVSAGSLECLVRAAASCRMRRVPGFRRIGIVQARAVAVADDRRAFRTAHCPISAGFRCGGSIGFRAGQDVVAVRAVATAGNDFAFLVESRLLGQVVVVAVKRGDIVSDLLALGVVPGTISDPIPGVLGVGG